MSEAIEKLDTLITESRSAEEAILFPLDHPDVDVPIDVIFDDGTLELFHRIKWPSTEALHERQQQTPEKTEHLGANRKRHYSPDGVAANAVLWGKFRLQVKGYAWDGVDPDAWTDVTPALAAEIPPEHKSAAIVGLFASEFTIERPEGKGYALGAQTYRVKQTYGAYTIYHVFSKHNENDRREIERKSLDNQYDTGTTRVKQIVFTSLKPYTQFYDKFFVRLEGVTGKDPNVAQRKDLVNAIWKQGAVGALMNYFEASRRDLKKN
jgi:hypothetical protein